MTYAPAITFKPTKLAKFLAAVFTIPAAILCLVVGISFIFNPSVAVGATAPEAMGVGLVLIIASIGIIMFFLFIATQVICINGNYLDRTWVFAQRKIPIESITRLEWSNVRGTLMLIIRYGKKFIIISDNSFKLAVLKEIENLIIKCRGLDGEPRWPSGCRFIDISEMSKRSNESPAKTTGST